MTSLPQQKYIHHRTWVIWVVLVQRPRYPNRWCICFKAELFELFWCNHLVTPISESEISRHSNKWGCSESETQEEYTNSKGFSIRIHILFMTFKSLHLVFTTPQIGVTRSLHQINSNNSACKHIHHRLIGVTRSFHQNNSNNSAFKYIHHRLG